MFCLQCGQQLPDGSKFCMNCGSPVPDSATAGNPAPAAPTPNAYGAPTGYGAPGGYGVPAGYGAPTGYGAPPAPPSTKEEWMLIAMRDAVTRGLKDPMSARFGNFENIEIDGFGRTYAEMVVHATNSYGAYVPTRYAVGFFDVTDSAPCTLIPNSLFVLPGVMVGAQRKVAKKMIKFGQPR